MNTLCPDRHARAWSAFLLGLAVVLAGCQPAVPSLPEPADFSSLGRVAAFEQLHQRISAEYAFTEWKDVDWEELATRYRPAVAAASSGEEYAIALRSYLGSVPDGHIALGSATEAGAALVESVAAAQLGGAYGMGLAELDDGRVIVAAVAPSGPAAVAGIVAGAEIVTWGQVPVAAAIAAVDLGSLVGVGIPATTEFSRLEQVRLLARAPIGTAVAVSFGNPEKSGAETASPASTPQEATLTAVADQFEWLNLFNLSARVSLDDPVVTSRVLDSGLGYLRITVLADITDLANYPAAVLEQVTEAVKDFGARGVPGLIVDVRGNMGGYDSLAASLCGLFAVTESVYEITSFHDTASGRFLEYTFDDRIGKVTDALMISPSPDAFNGPVVALVNPRTISSGEGIAMCIGRNPRGEVVGFNGTNGSFGMAAPGILTLPDGLSVSYPTGRSLDGNHQIQLDSRAGVGGVAPTQRVPLTYENALAFAAGQDPELAAAEALLTR